MSLFEDYIQIFGSFVTINYQMPLTVFLVSNHSFHLLAFNYLLEGQNFKL